MPRSPSSSLLHDEIPASPPATIGFAGPSDDVLLAELEALRREHQELSKEWLAKDAKIEKLTQNAVKTQIAVEVEEEKMTNKLLKRLEEMRKNKQLAEEKLRKETLEKATITSQVAVVHQNLVEIENQIETEQNCILHKLQRELIEVSAKKAQVQRDLYTERGEYLHFMRQTLNKIIEMNPDINLSSPVMSPTTVLDTAAAVAAPAAAHASSASSLPTSVASLQHELNTLLQDHYASESALLEDQMMCDMLSQMLGRVHEEVNVDRDRMLVMEHELKRAQADVAIAERSRQPSTGASVGGDGVGAGLIGGGGVERSVMGVDDDQTFLQRNRLERGSMISDAGTDPAELSSSIATVATTATTTTTTNYNNNNAGTAIAGSNYAPSAQQQQYRQLSANNTPYRTATPSNNNRGGGGGGRALLSTTPPSTTPAAAAHTGIVGVVGLSSSVSSTSPLFPATGERAGAVNTVGAADVMVSSFSRVRDGDATPPQQPADHHISHQHSTDAATTRTGMAGRLQQQHNGSSGAGMSHNTGQPAGGGPAYRQPSHRLPSPSASSTTSSISALRDHTHHVLTNALIASTPQTPHQRSAETPKSV